MKADQDQTLSMEIQCIFRTNLPEIYQVPDVQINLSTNSTSKELTQIVKQLIQDEGKVNNDELKGRKFNFMINNTFLTHTLQELLDKVSKSNEQIIEIDYLFALEKPKPTHSLPQNEWISTIKSLTHILNEKSKTYIVGFFNGDLKVFNKHDHSELLNITSLHQDQSIQDALFLRNDVLNKKIIVTCSQIPNPELKISELTNENKKYSLNLLAQSKEEFNKVNDGFKCLSFNPINNEFICSAFQGSEHPDQAIMIWKLTQESLEQSQEVQKGSKRQKTTASYISPSSTIGCQGGITSMKWQSPNQILVGCNDHSIKVINVEKHHVEEVLFTNHKIPTCIDAIQDNLVLTGQEDAVIRLWDIRSGQSEKKFKAQYEAHSKWISQVKFNYRVENLFLSGQYDGTVKMWDIRNEDRPLATLKKKGSHSNDEYKVFAIEWNGPSQILSGGSDSEVSVHEINA